jgi:membrane protease YdiL (CAAX protease family)
MMPSDALRQVPALFLLLVRHWARSGMAGSRIERFRKGSAFIVRLVVVVLFAGIGRMFGEMSLRRAAAGIGPVEWLVGCVLAFGVAWGILARTPTLRGMAFPLASPFIDALPVREGARALIEVFEVGLAHVVTVAAFVTAAPALPTIVAIGLGLYASIAAVTMGRAAMRWISVLLPPERVVSVAQVTGIAQGLLVGAAMAGQNAKWSLRVPFLSPIARPLAGGGGVGAAFAFVTGLLLVGAVALNFAERIGYDRVDVVPRKRFARAADDDLSVGRVDELLARREPGARRWPLVVFGVFSLAGLATLLVGSGGRLTGAEAGFLPQFFVGWSGYIGIISTVAIANRAVSRDLVARPLLAVLPLEPRELLDGKVGVVRRRILLGLLPVAFALLAPLPTSWLIEIAWRGVVVVTGVWIYGSAAVSVAFLTGGAQSARPQPGGSIRLESLLILAPLGALLFTPSPWTALVPLASLALVAFEARRAAMRVVRWLDDGEDFERETPAWRAALAFAAFQGSQVLAARMLAAWTTDVGILMGASYLVSGAVLVALTLYGRRDLGPLRVLPRHPMWIGLGLVGGVASATLGRFVAHRFIHPVGGGLGPVSRGGELAFVLTAGTLAPLVEELFFRGWLQHVITRDLGERRRWLAPVIAALAFASVHPPQSFPAVFALGIVSGVLYLRTSSLGPSVVAHAAHNWVATLAS